MSLIGVCRHNFPSDTSLRSFAITNLLTSTQGQGDQAPPSQYHVTPVGGTRI